MPKASRERIANRGLVEVSRDTGTTNVPAAVRVSAMGSSPRTGSVVAPANQSLRNTLMQLSGTFRELDRQAQIAQAKAEAEAEKARNKAEREAEKAAAKAEAVVKARQDSIDRISAAGTGAALLSEVNEKTRTGEWSKEDAYNNVLELLQSNTGSPAFTKGLEAYALKSLEMAENNHTQRVRGEETNAFLGATRQALHDLYSNYDPDRHQEYAQARTEIFESRNSLGIQGSQINSLELVEVTNQVKRHAVDDPAKAYMLLDLAEQLRPDGSPSLAASVADGYSTLQALREHVADTVLKESETERNESKQILADSTKDNYLNMLVELTGKDADSAKQWEADNIAGKTEEELKATFGDYRADVLKALEQMKSPKVPEGNDQAVAEWTLSIERGEADAEDIKNDNRLTKRQQGAFLLSMQSMTQDATRGYLPNSHLADMLLSDLQAAWPESVYKSPWSASREIEPGKPPVITPEGNYYQNEFLKRVRTLDPELDPQESNRQKLEILQDVRNDILSGKVRYQDNAGRIEGTFPELKLSEKIKEGQSLTEQEVRAAGKTFNEGGVERVREIYGVDYFKMDPQEQRRIAAAAQQQKAELDALKANTFFNRMTDYFANDDADIILRNYEVQMVAPVEEVMKQEEAKLEQLETRLDNARRYGRGLTNLNVIMLERDVKQQREYLELLKVRHGKHTNKESKNSE